MEECPFGECGHFSDYGDKYLPLSNEPHGDCKCFTGAKQSANFFARRKTCALNADEDATGIDQMIIKVQKHGVLRCLCRLVHPNDLT